MEHKYQGEEHIYQGEERIYQGEERIYQGEERIYQGEEHIYQGEERICQASGVLGTRFRELSGTGVGHPQPVIKKIEVRTPTATLVGELRP